MQGGAIPLQNWGGIEESARRSDSLAEFLFDCFGEDLEIGVDWRKEEKIGPRMASSICGLVDPHPPPTIPSPTHHHPPSHRQPTSNTPPPLPPTFSNHQPTIIQPIAPAPKVRRRRRMTKRRRQQQQLDTTTNSHS